MPTKTKGATAEKALADNCGLDVIQYAEAAQ